MFEKLYETELGQILVKQDDGDDGAEVKIFFELEGLGVCSVALSWKQDDNETQRKKADSAFEKMTENAVTELVKNTLAKLDL